MLKSLPQISEAEFEVMKIIWKYAPINTNEITEWLVKTTKWSPKTIQTLIKRLVTKEVITLWKTKSCICLYSIDRRRWIYRTRKSMSLS